MLLAFPSLQAPGYAVVASGLARAFSRDRDVTVLFHAARADYREFLPNDVEIQAATSQARATALLRRPGFERILYHFAGLDHLAADGGAALLGAPLTLTFQGWDVDPPPRLLRAADRITCLSDDLRRRLLAFDPSCASKVSVVPNGYCPEELAGAATGRWEGLRPYVLAVARLTPVKGLDALLFAFAQLACEDRRLKLVVVGDGRKSCRRWLDGLIARLGLSDRVLVFPRLDRAQVYGAMRRCLCFALPSREEPFGTAALEAMASGAAVVASRVGGLRDFICDGADGLLVAPADVAALTSALRRLKDDAELRRRLGRRAALAARERCWRSVARSYLR